MSFVRPTFYHQLCGRRCDLPKLFAEKPGVVLIFGALGGADTSVSKQGPQCAVGVVPGSGHRPARGLIERGSRSALRGAAPFAELLARCDRALSRAIIPRCRTLFVQPYWRALVARGRRRSFTCPRSLCQTAAASTPVAKRFSPLLGRQMLLVALIAASQNPVTKWARCSR